MIGDGGLSRKATLLSPPQPSTPQSSFNFDILRSVRIQPPFVRFYRLSRVDNRVPLLLEVRKPNAKNTPQKRAIAGELHLRLTSGGIPAMMRARTAHSRRNLLL